MRTGTFEYVFTSPEALSGSSRLSLDSDDYRQQLVALVVDEAHCITALVVDEAQCITEW